MEVITFIKRVTTIQKHRMYFGFVLHSEQRSLNRLMPRSNTDVDLLELNCAVSSFSSDIYGSLVVKHKEIAKGESIRAGTENLFHSDIFRVNSKSVIIMSSASMKPYLNRVFAVPRDSLFT